MHLASKLRFYVISELRCGDPVEQLERALEGGATAVQLRLKNVSDRSFLNMARKVRKISKEYDALFIVDDRVDIALALNADGVHLGREDIGVEDARSIAPNLIIGRTVRTVDDAKMAEKEGADYLGAGSAFPTSTKKAPIIGPEGIERIKKASHIPVVAIGGIKLNNLNEILSTGVDGVAVVSAVVCTGDVVGNARKFARKIDLYFRSSMRDTSG